MWTLFRIAALFVVLAFVVPAAAPGTAVGQFFGAIVSDVTGFCERQPAACHAVARTVDAGRTFLTHQIAAIIDGQQTLTSADRVLEPGGGSSAAVAPGGAHGG